MKPRMTTLGLLAGGMVGTAVAAVAVAGIAHHRRIAAERRFAAGLPAELPVPLPPDREYTVTADDGVQLAVEELDPVDGGAPELTAVLVHGFMMDRRCWLFQRHELANSSAPRVRQVLYDLRSHGRSGRSETRACQLEQLGRDLDAVIGTAAPEGPIVLIGHSLGGMTIMALAEDRPELFAERISGVAFITTSAGDIGSAGLPRPVLSRHSPVIRVCTWLSHWNISAQLIVRGRNVGQHLIWSLIRLIAFGGKAVNPALVELIDVMIKATAFDVITDFLPTLGAHSRYAALAGLRYVKTLVIGADRDLLIPPKHAEAIAALLPDAKLVQLRQCGHAAMMEYPKLVNEHLLELLSRCAAPASSREINA